MQSSYQSAYGKSLNGKEEATPYAPTIDWGDSNTNTQFGGQKASEPMFGSEPSFGA